jgi:hypothetical protein
MSPAALRRDFQMSKKTLTLVAFIVGVAVLAVGIRTAYAHCGKCLTDAKYFAGSLDESKMTLGAAATLAEVETKGKAVHATVQRLEKGVNVEVHCLVGEEIMAVVVDGQTGKVTAKKAVKDLDGHAT